MKVLELTPKETMALDKKIFKYEPWKESDFAKSKNYGVFLKDECIGYVAYSITDAGADLMRIGTLLKYRKKGYAQYLLHQSEPLIGVSRIMLEVSNRNKSAQRLYMKLSFNHIFTRNKYYKDGSDALVMEKKISE